MALSTRGTLFTDYPPARAVECCLLPPACCFALCSDSPSSAHTDGHKSGQRNTQAMPVTDGADEANAAFYDAYGNISAIRPARRRHCRRGSHASRCGLVAAKVAPSLRPLTLRLC